MFAAEFEPFDEDNRRRSTRAPVSFDAALKHDGLSRTLCTVVNISLHGVRLQTYSPLKRGMIIWLTLPGLEPAMAEVMWSDDYSAGCEFIRPLDEQSFRRLANIDVR